jgi:hypothetical protein
MLTHNTVQQIGYLIGMPYTEFNGQSTIPKDVSDGEFIMSGRAKFIKNDGDIPPMLIFTGLVSTHQYNIQGNNNTRSICVFNLKTLKTTKKSYRQIELPEKLKILIKSELNSI